jgi:hypothetical protein
VTTRSRAVVTRWQLVLIWASGALTVVVVWALLGGDNWGTGAAVAVIGPAAGMVPLAWRMRQRADKLDPDDDDLGP